MSKKKSKKTEEQNCFDEVVSYQTNDGVSDAIACSPYYQMCMQAMYQHDVPDAYPCSDTYQVACQPASDTHAKATITKAEAEQDFTLPTQYAPEDNASGISYNTPYMQVLTGARSIVESPYVQAFTQASNTPPTGVYPNSDSGAYGIPYEVILEEVQPEPGYYTYDSQMQEQKKRYSIFFIVALLSLAGMFLPFVNRLVPQLALGIDGINLANTSELPTFILLVLYVAVMLITLFFASYSIFSKGCSFVGFLSFLALLLALTFSVIQLDVVYNFDLEYALGQYGIMVMVALPLLILILSPLCIKKCKICIYYPNDNVIK